MEDNEPAASKGMCVVFGLTISLSFLNTPLLFLAPWYCIQAFLDYYQPPLPYQIMLFWFGFATSSIVYCT